MTATVNSTQLTDINIHTHVMDLNYSRFFLEWGLQIASVPYLMGMCVTDKS